MAPDHNVLADDDVSSLIVPASEGYLGILPRHAPMMVELGIGDIEIKHPDGSIRHVATSGGFLMVEKNKVTILADTAELAEDIDVSRALESKRRAEQRLAEHAEGLDAARAEASLHRAVNRLKVAGRL